MSEAIFALGTALQRGDGETPEVFATVGEVTDLSGPDNSMDTIEVTNHATSEHYKEFIKGLREVGEISATINLNPGDPMLAVLREDYDSDDPPGNWRILMPDGEYALAGKGFVSGLGYAFPTDSQATEDLTVQGSGKWEWIEVAA